MQITTFVLARLMPIWILFFSMLALFFPHTFQTLQPATSAALGFVLFLMGLTLDRTRLGVLVRRPARTLLGSLGKWVLAPVISLALAYPFFGHTPLAKGVLMAGIVPSGTSANLNALISGGDLALSVTMSAVDTFIGPFLTPVLSKWLIGSSVDFGYWSFVWKMVRIVFLPLTLGIGIQYWLPKINSWCKPVAPLLSAIALYVVVLGIVSGASDQLLQNTAFLLPLIFCVLLQIGLQMITGYGYAKLLRYEEQECRSLLFEVGICNTALAAVIANDAFGPLAGVAAMANMVCNLTLGSLAAVLLSSKPIVSKEKSYLSKS